MPKHARILSSEQLERRARNRAVLIAAISGSSDAAQTPFEEGLILHLERFVHDHATQSRIPYEGNGGLRQLLEELAKTYQDGEIIADGRLVGVAGQLLMDGHSDPVNISVSLGAGGQLAVEVGPSNELSVLNDALAVFDRQFHLACTAMDCDLVLVAQGYDPSVSSPDEISPLPIARFSLLGAYLARTGRYGRDMLRCTASTLVRLPLGERAWATSAYQAAAALAPILGFLTDNTLRLRGGDPERTPRMTRALVWDQVDAARCGTVPGTFDDGFGPIAYERWLEEVRPILFTNNDGVTFSCGLDTCARLMEERDLDELGARQLLDSVYPWARWNGTLELRAADALPQRMALGYAALIKGLFANQDNLDALRKLLNVDELNEDELDKTWHDLRELAWKAKAYGHPITQIAHELAAIAERGLPERSERQMLSNITQLWDVHSVPRDLLQTSWERSRPRTDDEEAAALWGEGAIIAFDDLAGDPPAGQTGNLRLKL